MDKFGYIPEENFFSAPNIIFDLDLKWYEKLVLIYLFRCGNNNSEAYPGYGNIASNCGISRTTALRAVKELVLRKMIDIKHRPKLNRKPQSNYYQLGELPSIPQTLVSDRHQSDGIREIPPLVSGRHYPSVTQTPYKELLINNHSIKKNMDSLSGTKENLDISPSDKKHPFDVVYDFVREHSRQCNTDEIVKGTGLPLDLVERALVDTGCYLDPDTCKWE